MPPPQREGKRGGQFIWDQGWRSNARPMSKTFLIAALVAASTSPAFAQSTNPAAAKSTTRVALKQRFDARFDQVDKDKNGQLVRAEIEAARASFVGATKRVVSAEVQKEFALTDKDKDGQASLAEMTAVAPPEGKAQVATVLDKLDANKDKKLSLAEFSAAAPEPQLAGIEDYLKRFDADKNGQVSRAEYSAPGLAAFDQMDKNKDGIVTTDEVKAASGR